MSREHLSSRKHWPAILLTSAALLAPPVWSQDGGTPAAAEGGPKKPGEAVELDNVVVTGSRIRRNKLEGPSPVTVITGAQIEREGFTTVSEVLASLTQNNTATLSGDQLTNSFTQNLTPIDLRGIGPGYTLTLINGRRLPNYPGAYNGESDAVNVGAIPAVAIERIEILSGGASAIYGSDAVAGVLNIVLKTEFEGVQLSARAGSTTEGGGESVRYQATAGKSFFGGRLKGMLAAEYLRRNPIYGFERDSTDSSLDAPTLSGRAPARNYVILDDEAGGYIDPGVETCASFAPVGISYSFRDPQGLYCGSTTWNSLTTFRNSDDSYSAYGNLSLDLGNQHEAYAFGSYYDTEAKSMSGAPFWFSGTRSNFLTIVDQNRPDSFGFGGQAVTYQRLFNPEETGSIDDGATFIEEDIYDIGVGLRGPLPAGFEYDGYFSTSRYEGYKTERLLLFDAVEEFFLGAPTGEATGDIAGTNTLAYRPNMDRLNRPITPDEYRSLSALSSSRNFSKLQVANASITGSLFQLPAGAVEMAAVLEFARQEYELSPDPGLLPDQQIYWGITATGGDGERDRYAVGLEFRVPIVDTLTSSAAFRYDKYDDVTQVDDALTYNLGLEFRPFGNLLVRGTAATSFRAPDMHYVFAGDSGFFTVVDDYYKCRKYEPDADIDECSYSGENPSGTRRGNPDLKEEEGISYTAGFVFDATRDLSFTVDYYHIELDDLVGDESIEDLLTTEADCRLGATEDGEAVDINSLTCQNALSKVVRGPDIGNENGEPLVSVSIGPINRAVLRTEGVDASTRYRYSLGQHGTLNFDLGWSHVLNFKFKQFEDDVLEDLNGVAAPNNDLTNYRSRMRGSVNWQIDRLDMTLFATRLGSIPTEDGDRRLPPYIRYNASVRYAVTKAITLSLIGNNIFNKKPERDTQETTFPYFDIYHYDLTGRELFAQAELRF